MTKAKMSVFVVADGYDESGITPLVRFTRGKPKYFEAPVRNATGVADIRARPMWEPGWRAKIKIRFDADQFNAQDVGNLLMRMGAQGGVGEGRADSKDSCGCGWGFFRIVEE
jgi:hypothetical protein